MTEPKRTARRTLAVLTVLTSLGFSNFAGASLFSVAFTDNDGPQWTGVVDSVTDSLSIQTWVEGPGGTAYWTPTLAALPLNFQAFMAPSFPTPFASLTPFDVPDNWDGIIGPSWGFLSDLTKPNIAWNEGVFAGNNSRMGWGIAQFNSEVIQDNFATSSFFQFTPTSTSGNQASEADTVTVNAAAQVPAPGSLFLLALGLAGLGISRRKLA